MKEVLGSLDIVADLSEAGGFVDADLVSRVAMKVRDCTLTGACDAGIDKDRRGRSWLAKRRVDRENMATEELRESLQ